MHRPIIISTGVTVCCPCIIGLIFITVKQKKTTLLICDTLLHDLIEIDTVLTIIGACNIENFDPETSAREKRKLKRKSYFIGKKTKNLYNEKGEIAASGKDICDCLDESCPGCHFPCPKCGSNKCGHECRCNRKWMYEKI